MISDIGESALITATFMSFFLPLGTLWLLKYKLSIVTSSCTLQKAAHFFLSALVIISFVSLAICFINSDFRLAVVANNSHADMAFFYRLAATWGHHEGSMLLFVLIYTLYGFSYTKPHPLLWHWLFLGLFLCYLVLTSNPFDRLNYLVLEGAELNPILQDPLLIIHPPILYAGYAGFSVPFCLTLAYTFSSSQALTYLTLVRQHLLMAWGFLTVGIALGSFWAYYELGWGGWWFWDPVENASLLPLIMGTALMHTIHGAKHHASWEKGVIYLSYGTYGVSLLGLFLVRSGLLSSVHSFASDPLRGRFLLGILGISMVVAGISFIKYRPKYIVQTISLKDRSFYYLIGIVLLGTLTFTLILGTVYPLGLQWLNLPDVSVGAPYFVQTLIPMGLLLLIPMAGVLGFAWKPLPGSVLFERCQKLLTAGLLLGLIVAIFFNNLPLKQWIGLFLSGLVAASVFIRPTKWPLKLSHGGFALSLIGMCLDTGLSHEQAIALKPGHSITVKDITFNNVTFYLKQVETGKGSTYDFERAHVVCLHNGKSTLLLPEKRYYPSHKTLTTETALHTEFLSHIYVVLGGILPDGRWTLRVATHPWVSLIWLGAFIMALGAFMKNIKMRRKGK